MGGFDANSISNPPSCDCNVFSSLTTASPQSILVAAAARPPALPFLLLPASRTATRAVLPVEQNVERRTCAHLACPHHRHVRTDSGRAPPHIPALPGTSRPQAFRCLP